MSRERITQYLPGATTTVVLVVALFYLLFSVVAMTRHGGDPLWFAWLGERYRDLDPAGRRGYDGQFVYYIASYGRAAIPHLDTPAYRLQRILLPLLVGTLSLVTTLPVAWMIPLVNAAAIVGTTYLLARWLADQGLSSWYALIYGLYVGVFLAYSRDLTEPLAYGFVGLGVTFWYKGYRLPAALALSFASLTKEITLIFAVGIFASAVMKREFKTAIWPGVASVPFLVWQFYLYSTLGQIPFRSGPSLEIAPLVGILPHLNADPGRLSAFIFAGLPALFLVPLSLWLLYQHRGAHLASWWVLLHAIFVILLPLNVYNHIMHAGRNAVGLILAGVFLLPVVERHLRWAALAGAVLPTLLWLIPVLRWAPWLSEI
jgi:hypothetical protein